MAATDMDQRRQTRRANDGESSNLESLLHDEGADWSAIRRALKSRGGCTNAAVIVSLQNEGRACCDDGSNGGLSLGGDEGHAHISTDDDRTSPRMARRQSKHASSSSFVATLEHVREEKSGLDDSNNKCFDFPTQPLSSTDEVQNDLKVVTVVTEDLNDEPRPERRKRSAARRLMGRGSSTSSTFRASLKKRLSRSQRSSSGNSLASSSAGAGVGANGSLTNDSVNIMDFGVSSHVPFTESMLSLASSGRRSSGGSINLADSCAHLVDSEGFLNWGAGRDNGSDVEPSSNNDKISGKNGGIRPASPASITGSNSSQEVDEQGFLGWNNHGARTTTDSNRPADLTGSNLSQDVDKNGFLGWNEQAAHSSTKSEAWNIEDYEGHDDEDMPPIDTSISEGKLSKLIKGVSTNVITGRLTAVSLKDELEELNKPLSTQDCPAKENDKTVEVRTALLRRISQRNGAQAEEEEQRPSGMFSALRRRTTISTTTPVFSRRASVESNSSRPVFSRRASVESNSSRTVLGASVESSSRSVFSRRASVESDYSRKASGSSTATTLYSRKSSRQSALSNEGGCNLRMSTAIHIRKEDGVDINAMRKELLEAQRPSNQRGGWAMAVGRRG